MAVIAVGGAKGGVGRSLFASSLAVFLAQLNKRVLLVDAHPHAPQLKAAFGVAPTSPDVEPWHSPGVDVKGEPSTVPNVRILSAYGEDGAVAGVSLRRPREVASLALSDHTVLDFGSGTQPGLLDSMLSVDAAVLVALPEPSSVEAVYRWLRLAYARALSNSLKTLPAAAAVLREVLTEFGGAPAPRELARKFAARSPEAQSIAWELLRTLKPWLLVNCTRTRADLELGEEMCIVAQQQLGLSLVYLGHIEFDDTVAVAARKRRPLLVESPGSKAARNLERVARKLSAALHLESDSVVEKPVEATPPIEFTHYDTLVIDRGVSDEEIRRAVRKMRDLYSLESVAVAGLCSAETLAATVAKIEEARDILLDPIRRRPYDLSISPIQSDGTRQDRSTEPDALQPAVELPPMPELTPDSEYSGSLLKSIREARGLALRDVAARTKIPLTSLKALEEEDYGSLPPEVYLRGFVMELSRQLKIDPEQAVRTFLRRFRERQKPR